MGAVVLCDHVFRTCPRQTVELRRSSKKSFVTLALLSKEVLSKCLAPRSRPHGLTKARRSWGGAGPLAVVPDMDASGAGAMPCLSRGGRCEPPIRTLGSLVAALPFSSVHAHSAVAAADAHEIRRAHQPHADSSLI